jgi:plastocyanin
LNGLVTYGCDPGAANRAALAAACGIDKVDMVVCINDFIYQPPIITPRQGDTVAWVNIEKCADTSGGLVNIVESLVAEGVGIGCDTHHEVVTLPDESSIIGDDSLDARICSPHRGIRSKPGVPVLPGFEITPGACGDPDIEEEASDTNVFCHTFENVGLQHYTCMTNPAHTAVLNGGILVLPKQLPALPQLPQSPQL